MIGKWREGCDVVWACRRGREGERVRTKLLSRLFNAMIRKMAFPDMPPEGMDFVLTDRKVVDAYLQIPEKNTNGICLVFWMGFKQCFIPYVKQARAAGESKWTLSKKIKLAIDSIVSFSVAPIRLMTYAGFAFTLAGLATVVLAVARFALVGCPPERVASEVGRHGREPGRS